MSSLLSPFPIPKNEYMGDFLASLARQMLTNIVNHVVMNTGPRVIKHVRFKYQLNDKQDAIFFINQAFSDVNRKIQMYSEFVDWCWGGRRGI
jgi:hypothetical protein